MVSQFTIASDATYIKDRCLYEYAFIICASL